MNIFSIYEIKSIFKPIYSKFIKIIIIYIIIYFLFQKKISFIKKNIFKLKNLLIFNKYILLSYLTNKNNKNIYFNVTNIKYHFSFKLNLIKIEYKIGFYDRNNTLINPSDMSLYHNFHLICHFKIINKNYSINSLPNIYNNNFYVCNEFLYLKDIAQFGIKISQNNTNYSNIVFFTESIINFNSKIYQIDNLFDPLLIHKNYFSLVKKMKDKKDNNNLKLKKLFLKYPYFKLKREFLMLNFWNFLNIYNFYFCFCLGELCPKNISQNCKYFFYLYIIDNNRNIYKKNHYLFSDFIFSEYSSDDTYPVFEQMEKKKFKVHYITEKYDIYKKYCYKIKKCLLVLLVNKKNYKINGDFLEKYLTIILKLKAVISGGGVNFNYIYNLFYIIEYITYISVGHGVSFFKYFLYADYSGYGSKVYNKILLPPSSQIISVAKKFGWKEKNIIKINLPRWDKYNSNTILETKNNLKNNSIFIMFTWRELKKNKKISSYYFKNILTLIESHKLNDVLKKKKIKLYFSLHHQLKQYNNKLKKNKYISFIDENQISECLRMINLLITDFSSIIFDIIYRRKPFIIYIPDSSDPNLKNIYKNNYVDIIESLKNETIKFENKYFNVEKVRDKIIYYINNNFKLDLNLIKFYDKMGLITGNNINKFIEYLKELK